MIRLSFCLFLILHFTAASFRIFYNDDCSQNDHHSKCPKGWKLFDRQSGKWCIRVFPGAIGREEAVEKCKSKGGTLSGIENEKENEYIVESAQKLIESVGEFWIGLKRVPRCINKYLNWDGCTAEASFAWTDNSTTGLKGLTWNPTQPDNFQGTQACSTISIAKGTGVAQIQSKNFFVGKFDDIACSRDGAFERGYIRQLAGYVCGKKP